MAKNSGNTYIYAEAHYSRRGVTSLVLALLSLLLMAVMTVIGMEMGEQTPLWTGAVGITAFVMAFVGMVMGLKSFNDRARSFLPSKVGTVMCGIMVAAWFLIFCVGIS